MVALVAVLGQGVEQKVNGEVVDALSCKGLSAGTISCIPCQSSCRLLSYAYIIADRKAQRNGFRKNVPRKINKAPRLTNLVIGRFTVIIGYFRRSDLLSHFLQKYSSTGSLLRETVELLFSIIMIRFSALLCEGDKIFRAVGIFNRRVRSGEDEEFAKAVFRSVVRPIIGIAQPSPRIGVVVV